MYEVSALLPNLLLKVGYIASIMWNLSIKKGLVKNARVQIICLLTNVVEVQLLWQNPALSEAEMLTFYLPCIIFEFQPWQTNWTI
jgi:hypothetical protein